jgi:hypothetical protein
MEMKIVTPDKEIYFACNKCGRDLKVCENDREVILGDSLNIIHIEPCRFCLGEEE